MRRLNGPLKQAEVRRQISQFGVGLCGLVEIKIRRVNNERIFRTMFPVWNLINNNEWSTRGRIWVCWDPLVYEVERLDQNDRKV